MIVLGLTGSIATGKSTTASFFASKGIPVFCADEATHKLMKKGGAAVPRLLRLFPKAASRGGIDRGKLAACIIEDKESLEKIEKILHPLVKKEARLFMKSARAKKTKMVVLDIPLLFESRFDGLCDVTLCAHCGKQEQQRRAMLREGMTRQKFKTLLSRQMSLTEKKRRADFVVNTGRGVAAAQHFTEKLIHQLLTKGIK